MCPYCNGTPNTHCWDGPSSRGHTETDVFRCWNKKYVSKPPYAIWPWTSWILSKTKLQELPAVGTTKTTMGLTRCQNSRFVINKHWQRSKGSSGCGVEDAEMWLGNRTRPWQGLERDCKMGIGRAELPKLSYHLLAHILLSTAVQRDELNPSKAKSKGKKYLLLI